MSFKRECAMRIAPTQTAKQLRQNLEHCSPNSRIDPKLIARIRRTVRQLRATFELLDGLIIDDSDGSLVNLVNERWLSTLLAVHNDPDHDFHFDIFEPVIIGQDLNPAQDIVFMNMTSLHY
jgi:hypothetical protein